MAIVFRNTKGSALTHAELDGNFSDLNNRVGTLIDSSAIISLIGANAIDSARSITLINSSLLNTIDAAYVQARQVDLQRDSAFISNIVDSNYVQARQTSGGSIDSAAAISLIDSAYVLARAPAQDFLDSAETINLIDSAYIQVRQQTAAANPAGSNTQVQFNDGGSSFGGDAGLVYSKDSDLK